MSVITPSSSIIIPPLNGFYGVNPIIRNGRIIPIRTTVLGNGQNDFYTVPTGKRAAVSYTISNQSGGALNHTFQIKIAGVYYTFIFVQTANNNTTTLISNAFNTPPVAEAGDIFSILTTGAGLVLSGFIIEFPTSNPIRSPRLLSLTSGDNTLYTCPVGRVATIGDYRSGNAGLLKYINSTGGARTIHWNVVKKGGTPSAGVNQITTNISAADATGNLQQGSYASLAAGDFISINTNSSLATQIAFVNNLVELPA